MNKVLSSPKMAFSLGVFLMTAGLIGCQSDSEQDLEIVRNQWAHHSSKPTINHGRVAIKLEPHGSIRAKVFQGQILAYEFILDRERQQDLLTSDIENADVYLTGEHRDGLVIDDLQSSKRYVLSFYDIENRLKAISAIQRETVFIRGYAVVLSPFVAQNL